MCSICASAGQPLLDDSVLTDVFGSVSFTKEEVISHALYLAEVLRYEGQLVLVSRTTGHRHLNQVYLYKQSLDCSMAFSVYVLVTDFAQ